MKRVDRFVSTVAALLEAAERHRDVAAEIVIDTHRSNPHGCCNAVCGVDIVAPHNDR